MTGIFASYPVSSASIKPFILPLLPRINPDNLVKQMYLYIAVPIEYQEASREKEFFQSLMKYTYDLGYNRFCKADSLYLLLALMCFERQIITIVILTGKQENYSCFL
jgi:hypothetical protein